MHPATAVAELGRALRLTLRAHRVRAKGLSQALGFHAAYLSRVLRGVGPLYVALVFEVLLRIKEPPEELFLTLYPLGGEPVRELVAVRRKAKAKPADEGRMAEFVRAMRGRAHRPLDPAAYEAQARDWLRDALATKGVSQRQVSRRLGLGQDALGQVLRGAGRLTFVHVFAVLDAVEVDPGRFFFELFMPPAATPAERLRRAQRAGLLETGARGTAGAYLKLEKAKKTPPKGPRPGKARKKR